MVSSRYVLQLGFESVWIFGCVNIQKILIILIDGLYISHCMYSAY